MIKEEVFASNLIKLDVFEETEINRLLELARKASVRTVYNYNQILDKILYLLVIYDLNLDYVINRLNEMIGEDES